jgi:hypothetical protein
MIHGFSWWALTVNGRSGHRIAIVLGTAGFPREVRQSQADIMDRQCLDRRLDNRSLMAEETATRETARNARKAHIH